MPCMEQDEAQEVEASAEAARVRGLLRRADALGEGLQCVVGLAHLAVQPCQGQQGVPDRSRRALLACKTKWHSRRRSRHENGMLLRPIMKRSQVVRCLVGHPVLQAIDVSQQQHAMRRRHSLLERLQGPINAWEGHRSQTQRKLARQASSKGVPCGDARIARGNSPQWSVLLVEVLDVLPHHIVQLDDRLERRGPEGEEAPPGVLPEEPGGSQR
mmetsp:Transcript_6528/g.18663  ORF Transcript_6528/g.18663 Transcript_6528/m.18663 type:complete len:214 (+) Transcript_6528:811-1452(+)